MSTSTLTKPQDTSTPAITLPLCSQATMPRANDDVCAMSGTANCPSDQAEIDRCNAC